MEKLQCYFFEEDLETSNSEEQNEKWICEMNYEECNRKGYCNGDC